MGAQARVSQWSFPQTQSTKLTDFPLNTDDPQETDQAPTAIQVFTSKMKDETCLQVGKLIDDILNGSKA
jgi:hypothetical protein